MALKELDKAFDAIEQQVFETFRSSDIHDDTGRQTCRLYLKVLDDVKERFKRYVIDGENSRKELVRLKKQSVMKRIFRG